MLIYNGLLSISVHLENPLGDDPADLPALAYQVCAEEASPPYPPHPPTLTLTLT